MDGLNLQAAWQIEHFGKQSARPDEHFVVGPLVSPGPDRSGQGLVRKSGPLAKLGEYAGRHFSRGSLGESQTKDAFSRGAGQHESQHSRG